MKPGYWKLVGQTPVPCTLHEWAVQFEDGATRRVALTRIGPYEISTVFLGLDHNFYPGGPPILFETMSFVTTGGQLRPEADNPIDGRDSTWTEAEDRHRLAVEWLQENRCEPSELPVDMLAQVPGGSAGEPRSSPAGDSGDATDR